MNKHQRGVIILPILIILALLIVVGYLVYQQFKPKPAILRPFDIAVPTSVLNQNSPTPTIDLTLNWQLYENVSYNFTFKYPNDYNLNDEFLKVLPEDSESLLGIIIVKNKNKELGQPPTIGLNIVQTDKSPKEYLNYSHQREISEWESFEEERGFKVDKPYIESEENVQNGAITALKVERQRIPTAPNSKETWYLFKDGNLLYIFKVNYGTLNPDTNEDGTDEKNTLDLIFTTFKFLE